MKGYSVEKITRVFNDSTGYYYEVGSDSDGLDLIAIRWGDSIKDPEGECPAMDATQARLLGEALIAAADYANAIAAKEAKE
jgi:hypothetical protein